MQSNDKSLNVVALVPAFNPTERLVPLVETLGRRFARIIVVNDGSGDECKAIFNQVSRITGVTLATHSKNQGKGASLKTGFRLALSCAPDALGVVTFDADGQHRAEDIVGVAETLSEHPDQVVLGVRTFARGIPWRSLIGNRVTRFAFRLLFGLSLTDTQTGLRGIPRDMVPAFIQIKQNRFEYETAMLLICRLRRTALRERPIRTIYENGNRSTNFKPVLDSLKVYHVLFSLAGILAAALILEAAVYAVALQNQWPMALAVLGGLTVFYITVSGLAGRFAAAVFPGDRRWQIRLGLVSLLWGALTWAAAWMLGRGLGMGPVRGQALAEAVFSPVVYLALRDIVLSGRLRPRPGGEQ